MDLDRTMKRLARDLAYRTPLRDRLGVRYSYRFTPAQLAYLCDCLSATRDVPGCVVEAGCSVGSTTLFLSHHLDAEEIEKTYFAVDTFSGFRDEDLEVELRTRGKHPEYYRGRFTQNDQRWFDHAMTRAGITRVRSVAADVGGFDYATLGPVSFALIDVVFYRPVKRALPGIWEALSPGGMIVVDDFHEDDSGAMSGAGQAYREFVAERGLELRRVNREYGLLVKERVEARVARVA